MKRVATLLFLGSALLALLPASPYLGVSQSLTTTAVEVGFITPSIEQNFGFALPLLGALDDPDPWYQTPVASFNLLYKRKIGPVLAIGVGPTLRMGWEYQKTICLQGGVLLQLSLEAPGQRNMLFFELGYLPKELRVADSTLLSALLEESITEFIRFGYRHAF